jgi:hypothetical protein
LFTDNYKNIVLIKIYDLKKQIATEINQNQTANPFLDQDEQPIQEASSNQTQSNNGVKANYNVNQTRELSLNQNTFDISPNQTSQPSVNYTLNQTLEVSSKPNRSFEIFRPTNAMLSQMEILRNRTSEILQNENKTTEILVSLAQTTLPNQTSKQQTLEDESTMKSEVELEPKVIPIEAKILFNRRKDVSTFGFGLDALRTQPLLFL